MQLTVVVGQIDWRDGVGRIRKAVALMRDWLKRTVFLLSSPTGRGAFILMDTTRESLDAELSEAQAILKSVFEQPAG